MAFELTITLYRIQDEVSLQSFFFCYFTSHDVIRIWTVWILIFGLLFAPWVLVINGQVEGETSPNDVVVVKDSEFTGDEVNVELFDPTASDLIEPQDPLAIPEDPELMEGQS